MKTKQKLLISLGRMQLHQMFHTNLPVIQQYFTKHHLINEIFTLGYVGLEVESSELIQTLLGLWSFGGLQFTLWFLEDTQESISTCTETTGS